MFGFCKMWLCVCVGFEMCGCAYVWVLYCEVVCMCGFCNLFLFVYVGFLMCRFVCMYGFCNVCVCVCVCSVMRGCVYVWVL